MKFLATILLYFAFLYVVSADNTYPYSYSILEYLQGGEVIITENVNDDVQSFFIKPNWTEEAEAIYTWQGFERRNSKGTSLGASYIISSFPVENGILSIWKENNRFFIAFIDTSLDIKNITELQGNWNPYFSISTEWLGYTDTDEIGFILNQTLILCRFNPDESFRVTTISDNVLRASSLFREDKKYLHKIVYVILKEGSGIVNFLTMENEEDFSARIPISEDLFLQSFGSRAAAISYSKSYPNSLLRILDPEDGVVSESWIETSGDKIHIDSVSGVAKLIFLQSNKQSYSLKIVDYSPTTEKKEFPVSTVELPPELIEPMAFDIFGNSIIAIFRNGIATVDKSGEILSVDFFPFGEYFPEKPKIRKVSGHLVLTSATSSVILSQNEHNFWYINRFFNNFGRILLPISLIVVIIFLFSFYRTQKTFLAAVLNLPASGAVFIIDKYGRLTKANSSGKKLLGITDSIPMRRVFRFYCEFTHTKPIIELVEKALSTKDTFTQKLNIVRDNDMFEWIFNVIALRNATGLYRGFVLTGIDITEQLERKRLSNWAQLAHDMQTNLSTIRLNAEQFEFEDQPDNSNRRKKIIHQVGLLIQRVRDVVTVGRSDTINRELVDVYDMCHEVRDEFDEAMFPHVSFSVDVEHFNIFCDKPKIIRAVRNAAENGIKSMQGNPGSITFTNWNDSKFAYIGVQDTGPGMDEATRKKMLTPYFTTAKKTGGAGIGTMIMQHVMELHGGEIKVKSEQGLGTQIIFCIPNYAHNRTSKAIAEKVSSLKAEK